jgi:hypothetical protein
MSVTKHTEGPWGTWDCPLISKRGVTGPTAAAAMAATADIRDRGYAKFSEVLNADQKVIAIALGITQEEAHANASLIAAAPELLQALIECRAVLRTVLSETAIDDEPKRWVLKARIAAADVAVNKTKALK